jgi:hypothetical protein
LGVLCRSGSHTRCMIWFVVGLLALAWRVVPLPLAVAVGRSLRQSSPEYVPERLAESVRGSVAA